MLRELTARGADEEIILATAAMHGLDDVSLAEGVKPLTVVNHYLDIGLTGLTMRAEDVRAEHAIVFMADSDWPWSGRAQQRGRELAEAMAPRYGVPAGYMHLHRGSRFSFEHVDGLLLDMSRELATVRLMERVVKERQEPATIIEEHPEKFTHVSCFSPRPKPNTSSVAGRPAPKPATSPSVHLMDGAPVTTWCSFQKTVCTEIVFT